MSIQLNDIPESCEGVRVLRDVQRIFPSAVLAGGYLRDTMLGRPPKDIDVMVKAVDFDKYTPEQLSALGVVSSMDLSYTQSEVREIAEFDNEHGNLPVQIVVLDLDLEPVERALKVDFGLCQIMHDGWMFAYSDLFVADISARTFTLARCETSAEFERSMRRFERLKEKYPDFTLRVPARFQHLAPENPL